MGWVQRALNNELPPDAHGAFAYEGRRPVVALTDPGYDSLDAHMSGYAQDARAILFDRADYDDELSWWIDLGGEA